VAKLSVATTKRYKDAEGSWQGKTQWHTCIAYSGTADYCAKIQTGDHVFVEGELIYREYERTIETELAILLAAKDLMDSVRMAHIYRPMDRVRVI
jgi:single-stranded DNA-binding protein